MTQAMQSSLSAAAEIKSPAVRQKGPRVFLDMDQEELDDAYTQIKYAPNLPQIVARYASNSAVTRARLGEPRRLAYGSAPIERARPLCHEGAERTDLRLDSWRCLAAG